MDITWLLRFKALYEAEIYASDRHIIWSCDPLSASGKLDL